MTEPHSWSEFAPAYALGTLAGDEKAAFEAHLAECAACRADVESYLDAAGAIGFGVPVTQPPAHLKDRVLANTRSIRPLMISESRTRTLAPWLAAAASLAAAITMLFMYQSEHARRSHAEMNRDQVAAQLAELQSDMAQKDSLLAAVLSPDAQSATLVAQGRPPSVRLYMNRRKHALVVAATDLAPAAPGRTYQLWGIAAGKPVSLGTFNTGPDKRAVVALKLLSDANFQLSAITDEPAGGSAQPTTTPFAVGPWSE